tara:strand:+ start:167 stop:928 length:762 start_codon:yes stop_codon:yes gene_type:complete
MYFTSPFRAKLARGEPCIGPSITYSDPTVTETLAPESDFLWIDTEHTPLSLESVIAHLLAARACATPALVRVPVNETSAIKRLLDIGASGVIVPQVRTVAEVERAVADMRYPPVGRRGFGPRRPADYGRTSLEEHLSTANENVFAAVQIETAEALESVEAIASVPGLDSIVLGPMDLSGALGRLGDVGHPEVEAAMDRVIAAARAAGITVGIGMGADPALAQRWITRGVHWVQLGCDFEYLLNGAQSAFALGK